MVYIKLAQKSDIPQNSGKAFEVEGNRIALFNVGGTFLAIDDVCTHAQCSLGEGEVIDAAVECPCHGSQFDLKSGQVLNPPAVVNVKAYNVKVEGEDVLVEI